MKQLILLSLILFVSCATQPYYTPSEEKVVQKEMEWEPNKNFWIGKNEEKLALHPIFATMPVESRKTSSGIETRRYVNGGSVSSSEECKGNHCAGVANTSSCNHVFYIEKSKITNYHRVGPCADFPENLQLRPLDKNGKFETNKQELVLLESIAKEKQARAIAKENEDIERSCLTRADCLNGMTCKISEAGQRGICVNHGIFGQLFNQ